MENTEENKDGHVSENGGLTFGKNIFETYLFYGVEIAHGWLIANIKQATKKQVDTLILAI